MKKASTLPFFIQVQDYHYFHAVLDTLNLVNPKIKIQEIEVDVVEKLEEQGAELEPYVAIVYEGKCPSNKTIVKMLLDEKTKVHYLPFGI